MKKIFIVLLIFVLFISGCNRKTSSENYSGTVTDLSEKCLSGGYIINVYRGTEPLGDDLENYGKSYITMTFNVNTNIYCNIDYDDTNDYVKQKKISNIRIVKSPKMGLAEEIYVNYGLNDWGTEIKGSNNFYTQKYDTPLNYVNQSSLAVKINKIALFDATNYGYDEEPTTSQIYSDLGITRDNVALTLGFRIEFTMVNGKILYKDFEVEMPSKDFDISGSGYQTDTTTNDTTKMETFLEKN